MFRIIILIVLCVAVFFGWNYWKDRRAAEKGETTASETLEPDAAERAENLEMLWAAGELRTRAGLDKHWKKIAGSFEEAEQKVRKLAKDAGRLWPADSDE